MPVDLDMDSIGCKLHRTAGRMAFNTVDYTPAGAGDFFYNIFRVVGLVELKAIYGQFTEAADAFGPSDFYLTFDDDAASMDLTASPGPNCTSAGIGATILKTAAAANAATYLATDQARVSELTVGGASRPFFSALLQAKPTVATNYIRTHYTMVDADEFSICWVAIWACRYPGGLLVPTVGGA